jgi:hypothetical protein
MLKHALKPSSAGFHLLSRMLQQPAPSLNWFGQLRCCPNHRLRDALGIRQI